MHPNRLAPAYLHLRLGHFAIVPGLLEPIAQLEGNSLAPECLNLIAVAFAMQARDPARNPFTRVSSSCSL
jgi:hypothetical protein